MKKPPKRRMNPYMDPNSVDVVVKKEKVRKKMYVFLFLTAAIAFTVSLILSRFVSCKYPFPICDVLSNVGYGIFASTFVALLIEKRDVRIENREFTEKYVLTMRNFLNDYIHMMALYREQAVIFNKEYEFKALPWSQWRDIVVQLNEKKAMSIGQDEHCNYNVDDTNKNCDELKLVISEVTEDIDFIFKAGPSAVINSVDVISYDRMYRIKNELDSVIREKTGFPEYLFTKMNPLIDAQCRSWFLLKGLDEEIFGPALGDYVEVARNRIHKLFGL